MRGLDGVELGALWQRGAYAYKSINVAGFPNLFMMSGPNSGPGHNSFLFYRGFLLQRGFQIHFYIFNQLSYITLHFRAECNNSFSIGACQFLLLNNFF